MTSALVLPAAAGSAGTNDRVIAVGSATPLGERPLLGCETVRPS